MRPVGDVAVDLGTSSTQLFVRGVGVAADLPTLVAIDARVGKVVAIGDEAITAAEQSGEVALGRPFDKGVVCDPILASSYLTELLRPHAGNRVSRLTLIATIPMSATAMERRVLREAAKRAGASKVHLIEQTMAAAIGAGLEVHEPSASMVVSVGAGVTESAMFSLGSVVGSAADRTGGDDVDRSIKATLRRNYAMTVSDVTAERVKLAAAEVLTQPDGESVPVVEAKGITLMDGRVTTAILAAEELKAAFGVHIEAVCEVLRATLVQSTPELSHDVLVRGMRLVGAASSTPGLAEAISSKFEVPVQQLDHPHLAAVVGAGRCLEAADGLENIFLAERF